MKRSPGLNLFLSSLAVLGALAPAALLAEPGRVEATRGDSMYVRDGMIRKMEVASDLHGGDGVKTGAKGQTQVDAGGATVRAGSNTDMALKKNRSGLTLNSGIVLVSNKSQSSAFDLEADRYRATSYGTMQVSYLKGKYLKVLCVEGKVKVGLKALMGDSVTLQTGQMVTITPTEERIPEPATVNLGRVASTSALMGPGFVVKNLNFPGGGRVGGAIAAQEKAIADGGGRAGKDTREKTTSDTDKTLAVLTGGPNNGRFPRGSQEPGNGNLSNVRAEFQQALNGRPATPELMYDILSNAQQGYYFRQNPGSGSGGLLLRRGGRP
jgi:hypothetical protein